MPPIKPPALMPRKFMQRMAALTPAEPDPNARPVKCFTPAHGPQQLVRVAPKVVAESVPKRHTAVVAAVATDNLLEQTELPMNGSYPVQRRRRSRTRRFLRCQIPVAMLGVVSALIALTHTITQPVLLIVINVITIACAFAAAIIPICFFALTPTLPGVDN
jgi:hypothetical protein